MSVANCSPCFVGTLQKDTVDVIDHFQDWTDIVVGEDYITRSVWDYDAQDDGLVIVATEALDVVTQRRIDRVRIGSGRPGTVYRLCNTIWTHEGLSSRRCVNVTVYEHTGLTRYAYISGRMPFSGDAEFVPTFSEIVRNIRADLDAVAALTFNAPTIIKPLKMDFDGSAEMVPAIKPVERFQMDFDGRASLDADGTKIQPGHFPLTGRASVTFTPTKYDPAADVDFDGSAALTFNAPTIIKPLTMDFDGSAATNYTPSVIGGGPPPAAEAYHYDGTSADFLAAGQDFVIAGGSVEIHFALDQWPTSSEVAFGYRAGGNRNRIQISSSGIDVQLGGGTVHSISSTNVTLNKTHILLWRWVNNDFWVEFNGQEIATGTFTNSVTNYNNNNFGLGNHERDNVPQGFAAVRVGRVVLRNDLNAVLWDTNTDGYDNNTLGNPIPITMPPYELDPDPDPDPGPDPPDPDAVWMGIGYDPVTDRTIINDQGYVDRLVTNDTEFAAALRDMRAGTVDRIYLRPKVADTPYVYSDRDLLPFDRYAVTGKNEVHSPAVIETEPASMPTMAICTGSSFDCARGTGRDGRFSGLMWKNVRFTTGAIGYNVGQHSGNFLYEDCEFFECALYSQPNYTTPAGTPDRPENKNFCLRYNHFESSRRPQTSSHSSNFFCHKTWLNMEFNTFYRGGWHRNQPDDRSVAAADGGPSIFSHNVYINKSAEGTENNKHIIRWNVFAEASSHGIHCRTGGLCHENLFLKGAINFQIGYDYDATYGTYLTEGTVTRNVLIEADDISTNPLAQRGQGIWIRNVTNTLIDSNLLLFNNTRSSTNNIAFNFERGANDVDLDPSVVISNNKAYNWGTPYNTNNGNQWQYCTTVGNQLDDGTQYIDPDYLLTNYNSKVVIPLIDGGNAGDPADGARPKHFTSNWIKGVIQDCHDKMQEVGSGNTWYVDASVPRFTPSAGTIDDPWNIRDALNSPQVEPGDTIYLRGGTYSYTRPTSGTADGMWNVTISGTEAEPIRVEAFPGEHCVMNVGFKAATINNGSDWIEWRRLEFVNLDIPQGVLRHTTSPGYGGNNWVDFSSVQVGISHSQGTSWRFINCVFHDTLAGYLCGSQSEGGGTEGCIIYDQGFSANDRGHVHGWYVQNKPGGRQRLFKKNIVLHMYQFMIQAYGTSSSNTENVAVEDNICIGSLPYFEGSAVSERQWDHGNYRFLFGGLGTTGNKDFFLRRNFSFCNNIQFGWSGGGADNCEAIGNVRTLCGFGTTGQVTNLTRVEAYQWDARYNGGWNGNLTTGGPQVPRGPDDLPQYMIVQNEEDPDMFYVGAACVDGETLLLCDFSGFLAVTDNWEVYDAKNSPLVGGTPIGQGSGDVVFLPMQGISDRATLRPEGYAFVVMRV